MNNSLQPAGKWKAKAIAVAVVTAMSGLSGCQLLGPFAEKQKTPDILRIQPEKKLEAKPNALDTLERKQAEKEYYPPTGNLYGAPVGAGAAPLGKEGKYTLNFDDADLGEVAKVILGDTLKSNYVINPKVTGKVSLQTTKPLADDELIPTLEMLLKMNGAALIKEGPLYRIEPEGSATVNAPGVQLGLVRDLQPGFQIRVVPLRYVGVQEMQKVVEPLMPPKSVLRADEARNLLVLAGSSDQLESILDTIRIFDVDFMRGMSVAMFPLKNVDATTIAKELEDMLGGGSKGPLAGMFRLLPIERLNAVMAVSPQPSYLEDVEMWINRLDRFDTNRTGNLHVYRVQNVDAADLANTLGQIFGQGGRSGGPRASIAPGMSGSTIGGSSFGGSQTGIGSSFGSSSFGSSSSSFGSGTSSYGSSMGGMSDSSYGSDFLVQDQAMATTPTTTTGTGTSTSGLGTGTSSSGFGTSSGGLGGGASGFGGTSRTGGARGGTSTDLGNNSRIVADPANNALIIMARPSEYKEIEAVIKELDIMPKQVLIDAMIVEVSLTGNLQFGLKWFFEHGNVNVGPDGTVTGSSGGAGTINAETATIAQLKGGPGFTYTLVNSAKDLRVQLNALAEHGKVKVLSTPSLMVLNNQQASINVGDKVPLSIGGGGVTAGGVVQGAGITYADTGVTLDVMPRVNAGGLVMMDILQSNSVPKQATSGTAGTAISQRKIRSKVAVPNGETLALGGLIQETRNTTLSGIPLLSYIPFLGWLFSQNGESTARTELVVLITPRTVEEKRDITGVTNEFRGRIKGFGDLKAPPGSEQRRNPYDPRGLLENTW